MLLMSTACVQLAWGEETENWSQPLTLACLLPSKEEIGRPRSRKKILALKGEVLLLRGLPRGD